MKSTEFRDKQIMELSRPQNKASYSFFDPDEKSEEEEDEEFDDDRSVDFHRIQDHGASWSRPSFFRKYSSMDHIDSAKSTREKDENALVSEVKQTIKEHFDNLLHSVDGLSARISQLESKTRQLENAVDDLKVSAEYNSGRTDGKLRQMENILREVQDDIHFLRDKQEIAETQLRLAKIQRAKITGQSIEQKTAVQAASVLEPASSASEQSPRHLLVSSAFSLALPTFCPDAPTPLYQNATVADAPIATQVHIPIPQSPIPSTPQPESYYFPAGTTLSTTYQQHSIPHTQQQPQPPPPIASQLHQPAFNLPQDSQSPQLSQLHPGFGSVTPRTQPPMTHLEETLPMPSHDHQSSIFQSTSQSPGGLPMQSFYTDYSQNMHGRPLRRSNSEFPAGFSHKPGPNDFSDMYRYNESPSHYSSLRMKPPQFSPSSLVTGGGSSYAQLPKAQILLPALPTAASVDAGSSSGRTANKAPIDHVVDQVTTMGFRRDLVRATVRKLTQNGQSVDLNAVLDKLMNNEGAE
ncbi:hypothetical protein U1Q18_027361 [Sarracenia purpurea var. burkii]